MKKQFKRGLSALLAVIMLITVFTSTPFTVNAVTHEHSLTHVDKKFPTTVTNGNIEYWYCAQCDKYFSDENGEYPMDKADTILPYFTFANEGGLIKLVSYNGNDEEVVVPETVPDNYPDENLRGQSFSIIKESAFFNNTVIKKVTIGNNVDHIAASCFASCTALTEVRIGTGLTYLGRFCFDNCKALKKVRILSKSTGFNMDSYVFDNYRDIVVYGYSGTALERKIESSFTTGLTFVPIDHTLRRVDRVAPTSRENGNIEYWYYTDTEEYFKDGQAQNKITEEETILPLFSFEYSSDGFYKLIGYNGDDDYCSLPNTIPEIYPDKSLRGKTVTVIREDAFNGNSTIVNVRIPDSYTHVGIDSFNGCANLKTVTIGEGLDYLEQRCFANCPKLEKVTIYSKYDEFGMQSNAFKNSPDVTVYCYCGTTVHEKMDENGITIQSVEHHYGEPEWSWSEDYSSASATFSCVSGDDTHTLQAKINHEVTKEATVSEDGEITYTATVTFNEQPYTDVKTKAIPKKHELQHFVKVDPTTEQNGNIEYWYCPECRKYFSDPDEKTEIQEKDTIVPYFTYELKNGEYVLTGYNGVDVDITVPEKIPENYPDEELRGKDISVIENGAFAYNRNLERVVLQDNIIKVDYAAFSGCNSLKEVQIGAELEYLGNACFNDCYLLNKVTIYSKKDNFYCGDNLFNGIASPPRVHCYHFTGVEEQLEAKGYAHSAIEHILGDPVWTWDKDYTSAHLTLKCEAGDYSTQSLPATITSKIIKQPTCLEEGEIEYTATCTYEGKTYTDVKTAALPKKCSLEHREKVYPTEDSHGNIEYWYCPECGKYYADPDGEEEIVDKDSVILPLFTFGYDDEYFKLISYNGNDEYVIVPDKVPDDYPDEALRGEPFSIIGDNAFKNNTTIKNVIIPDNIGNIGKYAFANCTNLTEVTIGNGLDYLSEKCFSGCPELKKVTIYSEDIDFGMDYNAFSGSDDVTVYGYRNTEVHHKMDENYIPFVPLDPENIVNETYSVSKTWDIDFANKDKPESIQVALQRKISTREWHTVQVVTLSEANGWQTEFDEVPSAYFDEDNDRYVEYKYRIRELGPKKDGDDELDPNAEDFQKKVRERLVYDTWDYDRPVITQLINQAKNPEVIWQFEPNVDWVKKLAKTTVISPPFVMFEIGSYFDGVKNVPSHTTKYKASYAEDKENKRKANITNLAVLDTTVYKRWLNFNEGEKPESVYLMLESKVQAEYAAEYGLTSTNFYTPSFSAVVGSLNLSDIPIEGETLRGVVKDGISKNLGDNLFSDLVVGTAFDTLFNKYFATGLTVGKATGDSENPLTRWRVKFTVKKYGMGEKKLPMDYAGAELVTGMMEMIIDALIHQGGLDFSIPVMYEPFEKYWSIKGYALTLLHDYERTCNVINIKNHSGSDSDDPDKRPQIIGGTKYWKGDNANDRPDSINLHVYYKDDSGAEKEVQGSPVTVTKGDTNGENGWTWSLEIPVGSPDRGKEYYIREEALNGYKAEYIGLDLINTKTNEEPPTDPSIDPSTEPTEAPTTEPTEIPTTEPVTEPSEVYTTEPATEPTEITTTEPATDPVETKETEPKTEPPGDDDDDDDDDGDPGIIIIPVPSVDPPVVPGGSDVPDDPGDPDDPSDPTEETEPTTEPTTEPQETLVVTKVWINDTESDRPSYLKIHVYNGVTEITGSPIKLSKSSFSGSNIWTSRTIKLDKGVNKNTLKFSEEFPSDYKDSGNYAAIVFGSTIYNSWLETNITGQKTWVDGNDVLRKRPSEITVNLLADGNKVDSVKVTAANGWKYNFLNKPIYKTENGEKVKIKYTVEEEALDDYDVTYDGFNITNTLKDNVKAKGYYKFTHIDRYGDERTKTVEVELKHQEILGYSGNNYNPGVPTYLWTDDAIKLYSKNPLVTASLAVYGNEEHQKDVSVYKNDVEWDLIKSSAADAANMTPDSSGKSLTVLAQTKPYTFTFNYYIVKDGKTEYQGTKTDVPYGKPVTFDPTFSDPSKYEFINKDIPEEDFCYWSADEEGLIPITTNRTFGMLLRGKMDKASETDRVVNVYAQYDNQLTDDWNPLIEEVTFTHMIEDNNDWVYLDYMVNYLNKDGKIVQDMVAEGDENIRYGMIIVKHPIDTESPEYADMVDLADSMIAENSTAVYTDDSKQSVAYRFEYGKPSDSSKPISNYNRVLYTLRSDTDKAENCSFSVIAYITVDGENYFYSDVNNDINVQELLNK